MFNTQVFGDYTLGQVSIFGLIILVMLIVDLHAHNKDKPISMKNAALWSVLWVALALGFSVYVGYTHGKEDAYSYLSGYLLEKSLSIDNLFVFMAIFSSFSVEQAYQHRVLYYGIIGALIMRLIFIALGTSIITYFGKWALTGFGLFVLWSAWKMWQSSKVGTVKVVDYSEHWAIKMTRKVFPVSTALDGHNFFTRVDGRLSITPLFLCLITIEVADLMFAFDSVPAVIAITQKPFLVYTSNIFAILGLRSMYFLLAAAKNSLVHLEKSVILILAFIGVKMLLEVSGLFHISPTGGLVVIVVLLLGGIAASLIFPGKKKDSEQNG